MPIIYYCAFRASPLIIIFFLCSNCTQHEPFSPEAVVNDTIQQFIGQRSGVLYLSDSLFGKVDEPIAKELRRLLKNDSSSYKAWSRLQSDLSTTENHPINFNLIKSTSDYQIVKDPGKNTYDDNDKLIGVLSYSNVLFDKEKAIGCFYVSFICGGHCGYGEMVYIKLEKGTWEVFYRDNLWVA